ncbi:MAG TPA: WD40 repeat domain-containing protein [Planctomycetota bacterium]|nr:WD40 repeat domain-containing protein [Planctomycetota bacterium]
MSRRLGLASVYLALTASVLADVSSTPTAFHPDRARLVREFRLPHPTISTLSQAILSGNGEVTAARMAGEIVFYSLSNGKEISKIETPGGLHDGAFSFDGDKYATANSDGKVRLWEVKSGKLLQEFAVGGAFS